MTEKLMKLGALAKVWLMKCLGFLKVHRAKIGVTVMAAVLVWAVGYGQYSGWLYRQPKFRNVTVELGEGLPELDAFLTGYADPQKVKLVTEEIDLTLVGTQELVFSHDGKEETVILTVQDTTAPKVEFRDLAVSIQDKVMPEDLVAKVEELSDYTVTFQMPGDSVSYGDVTVTVLVTDEYGNVTEGQSKISYRWMRERYTLELGRTLYSSALLYGGANDAVELDEARIDAINASPAGNYGVASYIGDAANLCIVSVQDTTAPKLEVRDVVVYLGEQAALEDFVVSATDLSGEVATRLTAPLPLEEAGVYTVTVEARDINGNVTVAEAELRVIVDTDPPEFYGMNTLYVEKYGAPAYYYGVSAVDARDGEVEFTVDTSRVNTSRAGTYYAVYTAWDNEGNEATYRRQVVVNHDAADTAALVASIAAGIGSDAESIRDYARDHIWYSSEWGGEDPVWYGFNQKNGNCYVHALCFQALLREKGYETMLIWVTDQSHYWNLVKIDGQWKHMDSTPGRWHEMYSIMNDETRYETLTGRDWDRTAWPAVE